MAAGADDEDALGGGESFPNWRGGVAEGGADEDFGIGGADGGVPDGAAVLP
jgi:hypothetical protein